MGPQEHRKSENVPEEGGEQLPPHLSPIHAQGGRESCLEGGSERVLILGGPYPAMPRGASTNCPFMEPLKESPVRGPWLLKLGEAKGEGVRWGQRDICLQTAVYSEKQGNQLRAGGGDKHMPVLCRLFYLTYLIHDYHPFWQERKGGSKKRPLLEAEPICS